MSSFQRALAAFVIALALDVATKHWAEQALSLLAPVPVVGQLSD